MKIKTTPDGKHAILKNGMPVYIMKNGTEREIDGAAAWNLALSAHFQHSPVMAGLKIPHDLAAAAFSDAFRIEGGKLVAVDKHGITMYSPTRHGQAADFNEAFAQLVNAYPDRAMIQREGGVPAAPGAGGADAGAPAGQPGAGRAATRQQFDAMSPQDRAQHVRNGGTVVDGTSTPAPAAPRPGAKVVNRQQFEQMPQTDRAAFCKSGGTIED